MSERNVYLIADRTKVLLVLGRELGGSLYVADAEIVVEKPIDCRPTDFDICIVFDTTVPATDHFP